jgi:hypothetical protein
MSFSLDVSIWMVKSPDDRAATANRPSDLRSRRRPFCIVCARTIRSGILLALDRDVTLAAAASGITLKPFAALLKSAFALRRSGGCRRNRRTGALGALREPAWSHRGSRRQCLEARCGCRWLLAFRTRLFHSEKLADGQQDDLSTLFLEQPLSLSFRVLGESEADHIALLPLLPRITAS